MRLHSAAQFLLLLFVFSNLILFPFFFLPKNGWGKFNFRFGSNRGKRITNIFNFFFNFFLFTFYFEYLLNQEFVEEIIFEIKLQTLTLITEINVGRAKVDRQPENVEMTTITDFFPTNSIQFWGKKIDDKIYDIKRGRRMKRKTLTTRTQVMFYLWI